MTLLKLILLCLILKDACAGSDPYRLPRNAKPVSYDITVLPNITAGTFVGEVYINIELLERTDRLVLHYGNMSIDEVYYPVSESTPAKFELDKTYNFLKIRAKQPLDPGKHGVHVLYRGNITDTVTGIYRTNYTRDGIRKYMITTKFEATHAREAFPCFDEPNFKAVFSINVAVPNGPPDYIAISNMPVKHVVSYNDQWLLHRFERTPIMSTYLAIFIVTSYTSSVTTWRSGTNQVQARVFSEPEIASDRQWALGIAKDVINYMNSYTDIPSPLKKIDVIGIQNEFFEAGAMENWGLITFKESRVYFNEKNDSINTKRDIALVVAHELSHFWFGNIMTMDWWDELWLNEGFAKYFEYKIANDLLPSWKIMDQFIPVRLRRLLEFDSRQDVHPLINPVSTPKEIKDQFDTITYNKGAAILRMLEDVFGRTCFQNALKHHLRHHLYNNTITKNLIKAFVVRNCAPRIDMEEMVNTWTMQRRYPVINIRESPFSYIITQQKFLDKVVDNDPPSPYNYRWIVPISYFTNLNPRPRRLWLKTSSHIISKMTCKWIKFNTNFMGYYRTNYTEPLWNNLIEHAKELPENDLINLLVDSLALKEASKLHCKIPMMLLSKLQGVRSYMVWATIGIYIKHLANSFNLQPTSINTKFQNFMYSLIYPAFQHFTWIRKPDDTNHDRLARVSVVDLICYLKHRQCVEDVKTLDSSTVDADVLDIFLRYKKRFDKSDNNVTMRFEFLEDEDEDEDDLEDDNVDEVVNETDKKVAKNNVRSVSQCVEWLEKQNETMSLEK